MGLTVNKKSHHELNAICRNLKSHADLLISRLLFTNVYLEAGYVGANAAYRSFGGNVGGIGCICNTINRSGFHGNRSLGGSLSCLIPSVIKALAGEGLSMTGRDGKSSIKTDRDQKQEKERRNRSLVMREYYKGTEVSCTLRKVLLVV